MLKCLTDSLQTRLRSNQESNVNNPVNLQSERTYQRVDTADTILRNEKSENSTNKGMIIIVQHATTYDI